MNRKEASMTTEKSRLEKSNTPTEAEKKAHQNKQSGKDAASHTKASTNKGAGGGAKQKRNH
jgi:hypothetical protein